MINRRVRGKKITTESARELFEKYGYMPPADFEYRGYNKKYRVFDEVHNKYTTFTYRTLLNRIKSGKVQPVDPFLHTIFRDYDARTDLFPTLSFSDRLATFRDNLKKFVPKFEFEPVDIQIKTMEKAKELHRLTLKPIPQNAEIQRKHDDIEDKSAIYAVVETLCAISQYTYENYKVVLEIQYDDPELPFLYPHYFTINSETLKRLEELINYLFYGVPIPHIDDSDKYTLYSLNNWVVMTIWFERWNNKHKNRLDDPASRAPVIEPEMQRNQRRHGAKWAWINKTSIDLSRYGIFNKFDEKNYKYSCFVYALEQSQVLTSAEIEYVKSVINTKSFPMDHIEKLCKTLNISIYVYVYNTDDKKVHGPEKYGQGTRLIKLLLRDKHYMIYEQTVYGAKYIDNYEYFDKNVNEKAYDRRFTAKRLNNQGWIRDKEEGLNINSVINHFFENKYFKPLTEYQLKQSIFTKKVNDFIDLSYPECSVRPVEYKQNIITIPVKFTCDIRDKFVENGDYFIKNINLWFPFKNPIESEINQFKDIMKEKFDINIDHFRTLAAIGRELMHKYGCFDNVYELSGKPAKFIKKCAPKVIIAPAFNSRQTQTGDFVCVDKIGSYTSIYTKIQGIPCGKPKIITEFDEENNYDDYYICVNITNFTLKHSEMRFPQFSIGINYFSKISFENVLKHYNIEYDFVSGYYFNEGFNNNLARLATDLFAIRAELKSNNYRIESCIKTILNSLWGRATYKPRKTIKKIVPVEDVNKQIEYNNKFVFQYKTKDEKSVEFSLSNPISLDYGIPQFSSNILSYSRAIMNDIYFKAADLDVPIYYSNTDCLLISREDVDKLGIIGDNLGDFAIEYDNIAYFDIISGKKFIWEYSDDKPARVVNYKL